MASIESIMHKPLVSASGDETVAEISRRMGDAGVGCIVVLDGDVMAGIFTERDLLTQVIAKDRDPDKTRVGDVATREVVTVDLGTRLRDCATLLRDRGIRHLPVLDQGRPVGILSARDFFERLAKGFEGFIERARYDEALRDDVDPYDHVGGSYGR